MSRKKKHNAPQFEFPIAGEAFNLTSENIPAPKDNEGKVYVLECRRGEETWLAYGGLKMTRDMAELTAQHSRQIWKEVTYTVKKVTP